MGLPGGSSSAALLMGVGRAGASLEALSGAGQGIGGTTEGRWVPGATHTTGVLPVPRGTPLSDGGDEGPWTAMK